MNKLVVNHLDKTIVTSDGATIVRELEVMHPAAKMVVMASQMQEQEAGDGTSLVVTLTGERSKAAAVTAIQQYHYFVFQCFTIVPVTLFVALLQSSTYCSTTAVLRGLPVFQCFCAMIFLYFSTV